MIVLHKRSKLFLALTVPLLAILTIVFVSGYVQRGIQGRIKDAADTIGEQFSPGNTPVRQYEPYYLSTSYKTVRKASFTNHGKPADLPAIRKIIRTASLNLEVENSEITAQKIKKLVHDLSGVIIQVTVQKTANDAKTGSAVFKVKPKDFGFAVERIKGLGKIQWEQISGEDVTEEYVDLKARLHNYERVKARLMNVLDQKAFAVKDILEVERELARLSENIERIEGRMKYVERKTDLATITVNFHEPRAISSQSLGIMQKFKDTLRTSAMAFIDVFNGIIIVIAALLPIALWVVLIAGLIAGGRKLLRKRP